jgi:hypothetical protein
MWNWIWEFLHPPVDEDDDSTYPDDCMPDDMDCPDTEPTAPGALGDE